MGETNRTCMHTKPVIYKQVEALYQAGIRLTGSLSSTVSSH